MSRSEDLKALLDMEAELEGFLITDELDWMFLIAELSWNPWFYAQGGKC